MNERLETSAANVWAIGECAGGPQFTHVAVDDFRIVRDNLSGADRTMRARLTPCCMFTDPPLARVGLGEEARRRGFPVRVAKMRLADLGRDRAIGETEGFMKAVVADDALGFAMIDAGAGEVVAAVQMAMLGGLSHRTMRDVIIAHPTMAESLGPLFAGLSRGAPTASRDGRDG